MKPDDIAVSVIIPVGPKRSGIKALSSLAASAKKTNIEIICIADGQEAHIAACASHLTAQTIKLHHRMGASAARNIGAFRAQAKVLLFLDDDDSHLPGTIDYVSDFLRGHSEIRAMALKTTPSTLVNSLARASRRTLSKQHLTLNNLAGGCSTIVVDADLFRKIGGFNVSLPSMQDWDFWLRITDYTPIFLSKRTSINYCSDSSHRISDDISAKIIGLKKLFHLHHDHLGPLARAIHKRRLNRLLNRRIHT